MQTVGAHNDCCILPKYHEKFVFLLDNVGRSDYISRAGLASQSDPGSRLRSPRVDVRTVSTVQPVSTCIEHKGECKLIYGCSLELCSATSPVASSRICHRNKSQLNCMTILRTQPEDSKLHYITWNKQIN